MCGLVEERTRQVGETQSAAAVDVHHLVAAPGYTHTHTHVVINELLTIILPSLAPLSHNTGIRLISGVGLLHTVSIMIIIDDHFWLFA